MHEVVIKVYFAFAVLGKLPVSVAVGTFNENSERSSFALGGFWGDVQSGVRRICDVGGGLINRWFEDSHLRDEPVAIEIAWRILVQEPVAIGINHSTCATSVGVRLSQRHFRAVGIQSRN